jgi:hypothetical protein
MTGGSAFRAQLRRGEGKLGETPDSLAAQLENFIDHGCRNLVGGCCGTTSEHIKASAFLASRLLFNQRTGGSRGQQSPLIVGERINVIGRVSSTA